MKVEYEPPQIVDLGLINEHTFNTPSGAFKGAFTTTQIDAASMNMELSHSDVAPPGLGD